jgi:hypothetical protein
MIPRSIYVPPPYPKPPVAAEQAEPLTVDERVAHTVALFPADGSDALYPNPAVPAEQVEPFTVDERMAPTVAVFPADGSEALFPSDGSEATYPNPTISAEQPAPLSPDERFTRNLAPSQVVSPHFAPLPAVVNTALNPERLIDSGLIDAGYDDVGEPPAEGSGGETDYFDRFSGGSSYGYGRTSASEQRPPVAERADTLRSFTQRFSDDIAFPSGAAEQPRRKPTM